MYIRYKSLNDLLDRQDLSVSQKRRALKRLPFDIFAHDYLMRMNMMKVASSANETTKGTQIELGSFVTIYRKYRQHKRLLKNERIRKENEAFAAMMDKKATAIGNADDERAAKRTPYGHLRKFAAFFKKREQKSDKPAA